MSFSRRRMGVVLALSSLFCQIYIFVGNTDFPVQNPRTVVDDALIAELRANPGLHVPLAEDYTMAVSLDLEADDFNMRVYGTTVDLRERVPERAIHIQQKGKQIAIHADHRNPKASWWMWILHGTLDVPFIPLAAVFWTGVFMALKKSKTSTELNPKIHD